MDKLIWRCRSRYPNHDIKINIRKESILKDNHQNIQIIYFLLFYCFTEIKSIMQSLTESESFSKQVGVTRVNKNSIINFFSNIRGKIRIFMHKKWSTNLLVEYISDGGYASVEIDESEVIGNGNEIYWMFGIIDRNTKEARIFCVFK